MTALRDVAHVSVRGHDVIPPPERPAMDWKAATRVVWQRAKLAAHAHGSDVYDGIPGALYTGSIGGLVPHIWPELDTEARNHAKNRIAQDITLHGAARCIDRGNYRRGIDPSWFIADQYGALPVPPRNRHRRTDSTSKPQPEQQPEQQQPIKPSPTPRPLPTPRPAPEPAVQVDEVTARKLGKLPTKADKMRLAIRVLGDDATPRDIVRWLKAYGHTVSNPHANQVLGLWRKSGGKEYPSSKAVQAAVEATAVMPESAPAAESDAPAPEPEQPTSEPVTTPAQPDESVRLLGTTKAAEYLGVSQSTLIRRSEDGILPCKWDGPNRRLFRKWRVADLDAYRASSGYAVADDAAEATPSAQASGKPAARRLYGRMLSIKEAAEYLGLSKSTVERYTTSGELTAVRIGPTKRVRRWRRVDLDAYKAKAGYNAERVDTEAVAPVQPAESAVAVVAPAQETAVAVADTTETERSVPQYEITSMRDRIAQLEADNAKLQAKLDMAMRMIDGAFRG